MQQKQETDDKDAAVAKQTVKGIPSDLRRTAFIVGVVCWIIALISAVFAAILVIIMVEKGSFDCALFARLGLFVIFSLIFGPLGRRYCRRQPVDAARSSAAKSPKYNKYNDPAWCMGVLGIVGGVLCLLLAMREVIEVFRNHTFVIYSFIMLLAGLYCYFRWRRRTRCAACFESFNAIYHRSASTFLFIAVTEGHDRILFGRPREPFSIRPRKPKTQDELEDLVKEGIFTHDEVAEILERRKNSEMIKESKQTQEVSTPSEDLSVEDIPIWYRIKGEWDEGVTFPVRLLPNMLAEFANHASEGICIDGAEPQRVKYIMGMTEDFHYYVDIIGTEGIA